MLPTSVLPKADVPRLTVTFSRIIVLSPMEVSVFSPVNFRSWGISPMLQLLKIWLFLPILVPLQIVVKLPIIVLSPIETSSSITEKGPTETLFPKLAFSLISDDGCNFVVILRSCPINYICH